VIPLIAIYRVQAKADNMSTPLLTLGSFSFIGLESPEQVLLKSKQRLAVHHLGSGSTATDSLGEDYEIASFSGVFSGINAPARIRSIEYLRLRGAPLLLTWGSRALSVIIREFELTYSSNQWVPYRLSCFVVRSNDPEAIPSFDVLTASADIQAGDILDLLQNTDVSATCDQTAALVELAALNYDTPPSDSVQQATELLNLIESQIAATLAASRTGGIGAPRPFGDIVAKAGQQATLVLAQNRLAGLTVRAQCLNQP
jgi:hypothetical protein